MRAQAPELLPEPSPWSQRGDRHLDAEQIITTGRCGQTRARRDAPGRTSAGRTLTCLVGLLLASMLSGGCTSPERVPS